MTSSALFSLENSSRTCQKLGGTHVPPCLTNNASSSLLLSHQISYMSIIVQYVKSRWVSRLDSSFKATSYWKYPQTSTPIMLILITPLAVSPLLTVGWTRTQLSSSRTSPLSSRTSSKECCQENIVENAVKRTWPRMRQENDVERMSSRTSPSMK